MDNLTGNDTSLAGQFARFRDREKVTIITFSSQVKDIANFDINVNQPETLKAVRDHTDSLNASGSTAIYSALQQAYSQAVQDRSKEPDRIYSIVLMSDGENNTGTSSDEFFSYYKNTSGVQDIRTFTILFGEADAKTMQGIADTTGGQMFDASKDSLSTIFKQIRGYQ
jgi:Ca-activated chloride channel family protein